MTIPNIPTDNYYKFFALSGVAIAFATILFFSSKIIEIYNDLDIIKSEIKVLKLEEKFLERDMDNIDSSLTTLRKSFPDSLIKKILNPVERFFYVSDKLLHDKKYRDYYEFVFKYEDKILPEKIQAEIIGAKIDSSKRLNREIERKNELIKIKNENISKKINRLLFISIMSIILVLIGYKMAKYGFNRWYEKVQKPSDEKLALELENLKQQKKSSKT